MQSNRVTRISCLLDTDVAIDFLRQREYAQRLLESRAQEGLLAISVLTQLEIYRGMRARDESVTNDFLDGLISFAVDIPIARRAGTMLRELRLQGMTIGVVDAVIAATALQFDAPLLTNNVEHYPFPDLRLIKGLEV